MVRILGRFGDTHVTPGPLLAMVGRGLPPAGSVDVQFRVPVSLSLVLDAMAAAVRRAEIDVWSAGYRDLMAEAAGWVQRAGGYALESPDTAVPARLDVATTIDEVVAGVGTRWHGHVWVGPTALTVTAGESRPVAVDALVSGVHDVAWPTYIGRLEELSVRTLGVRWGEPRPAALREVVEPPWHEHVGADERGVCARPPGAARHVVLADDQAQRLAAAMEGSHQAAVSSGTDVPPPDDPAATRAALMRGLRSVGPARAQRDTR